MHRNEPSILDSSTLDDFTVLIYIAFPGILPRC